MTHSRRGFSLIDVMVGTALLLVLFMSLFGILKASLTLSALTKAKAAAVELANTQIEYLRGLAYDNLGTVGGIPPGPVPQLATSTVDGVTYVTRTYVQYYDDPADGFGAADTNGITTDYKNAKVTISYKLYGLQKSVTVVSNFVPPGIESSTGGGTLSIHVVNAVGANVSDATVQIIDASTTPTINFTTFTDSSGLVGIGGAATSSQYQIYVSDSGYSSAQTYARTSQNVNPNPGYLTVVKNQTTSATFAIDHLSTLALSSFSPATTTVFSDTFANSGNLSSQNNTQVAGGALTLLNQAYPIGYSLSGSARSIPITPNYLNGWGMLSANMVTPSGTTALVYVDDTTGTPLPDAVLPGNGSGFSSFPVSLTGISTTTYPGLELEADFTSNATTTTPSLNSWSISHTEGPQPLPNVTFTLTGTKTVGTDPVGQSIYKTVVSSTTGATATAFETLEWDAYSLALSGSPVTLIESCQPAPYQLPPAVATTSSLIVMGKPTATTLPVIIQNASNNPIGQAKVVLSTNNYAATVMTSACGLAYFGGLINGTYSATVSAAGHITHTFSNINVIGHTATTTLTLP